MLFSFTFAFTVLLPRFLLDWCLFSAKTRDENSSLSGVARDERGEGKNNKVFTLNPLCNSEIREVGEEVKAFFRN